MKCRDCHRLFPSSLSSRYVRCEECRSNRSQSSSRICRDCNRPIFARSKTARCADCRRVRRRVRGSSNDSRLPLAYKSSTRPCPKLDLGSMSFSCPFCSALHWKSESSGHGPNKQLLFESCCKKGAVVLQPLPSPPPLLRHLFQSMSNDAVHFRKHIRSYNAALSYTSFAYTPDSRLLPYDGQSVFQLQGAHYHYQGPLQDSSPTYAQLFFLDPNEATDIRVQRESNSELHYSILASLDTLFRAENPFWRLYHRAVDILNSNTNLSSLRLNPQLRLITDRNQDPRRYNLPTVNTELSALIPDIPGEYASPSYRDILLYRRSITLSATGTEHSIPSSTTETERLIPSSATGTEHSIQSSTQAERLIPSSATEREHFLSRIHPDHALYSPLHYVLFYPRGGRGYHRELRLQLTDAYARKNINLTPRMFYRFYLHTRPSLFQTLHRGSLLFQQFIVDAWASTEGLDLDFLRYNQKKLRADRYTNAYSAIRNNVSPENIGQRIILPSSFTGGDRFMQRLYQDSMAIVRHFGRPCLFITFTTNPEWPEITRELLTDEHGALMQTWDDRPDLVARVFAMKLKEMLREIRHDDIFGTHVADVYTVEFQKRGLPHAHIIVFLDSNSQFNTPEKIDEVVSAEIPDPTDDLDLYDIVCKFMIHRPCVGYNDKASCIKDRGSGRRCSKHFPKPYMQETTIDDNTYPSYRRRPERFTASIKYPGRRGETLTVGNEWVVPYNPYLCKKYNAHINVEVCGTIRAIRYIHKYIYKGSDRATVELRDPVDEIKQYVNCRFLGSSESAWKTLELPMHGETPPVMQLPIHLPGQHYVSFDCAAPADHIMAGIVDKRTPLIAFFEYNASHPDAQQFLYQDFPLHFTWDSKTQMWKQRQRGTQIGRMYQANPFQGELYYLRLLLTVVRGASSFDSLRMVDNVVYDTFETACRARGLLIGESNWESCFTEAKDMQTGWYLRRLLISAIVYGGLSDASNIWNLFRDTICDDLPHLLNTGGFLISPGIERPDLDYGLYLISQELIQEDRSLNDFNLPNFINDWDRSRINPLIRQELDYDRQRLSLSANRRELQLNSDQQAAYSNILCQITNDPAHAQFFLNGPGGTGKTFLYITLCERLRSQGKIVLCVAYTGIAALLLPGGRTAHKRFKIPMEVSDESTCFIQRRTQLAELLCRTDLIIWDEAPMTDKAVFNAVNRSLQDIRSHLPGGQNMFGGIPTVLGGDFQQILPVVLHGNRADTVQSCLQESEIWKSLTQLYLRQNMRLANMDSMNTVFATWLTQLSTEPAMLGQILIPDQIYHTACLSTFIERIYPQDQLDNAYEKPEFFIGRAILCPRNSYVDDLNDLLLQRLHSPAYTFESADQADLNENALGREELTAEYLRSIKVASLPLGVLQLRIGAPLMLMRNLDPNHGLCNGTRMTLLRASRHCLEVRLNGGDFNGQCRLIYRCSLSTNAGLNFCLKRTQFPVRLAFAMTINKAQGQSLQHVAIDLRHQVFTHGQLYVALSRTIDVRRLSILLALDNYNETVENVVYPEVLRFLSR
jgi:hypothetical protein